MEISTCKMTEFNVILLIKEEMKGTAAAECKHSKRCFRIPLLFNL